MGALTPISVLTIVGVVFLFLAAFGVNFPRVGISSGWLGLALIYLAVILPALGLSANVLILLVAILLLVLIIVLIADRLRRAPA